MRRETMVLLLGLLGLAPGAAQAATHAALRKGGGLGPLDVKVDLATGEVIANGTKLPIDLDRALYPSEDDVVVEDLPIGQGKHVAHVRVPARAAGPDGPAWEAILAAGRTTEPIFAGKTGLWDGDPGERRGDAVRIVRQGDASVVVTGKLREDVNICGRTDTLLEPQALYPSSLSLRTATVQRLDPKQITEAEPITATRKGPLLSSPLARLLVATASSIPDSRGAELTDGDPQTVWNEQRPGMGQGEFVVMAAPKEVPIARMDLVIAPPKPDGAQAAPKDFFFVTSSETFAVRVPDDASQSREVYEVDFPKPVQTSCLALVLGDAYTRGLAHPEVGLAEIVAYSEFDVPGATLDDVATRLGGPRGDAAESVLERAGKQALGAAERAYEALDERGRARAIDVAASHDDCGEAAPLLARGLCEKHGEAPRKAREKLERCKEAAPAVEAKLRDDPATRACVASTLVYVAHDAAIGPVADALERTPESDHATRDALRTALSQALDRAPSPEAAGQALAGLLADARFSPAGRLEMMRAAGDRVALARAESASTLDLILAGQPPIRTRYLALGPLAVLAHAGDHPAAERIAATMLHDADWPVRRLAAKLGAGLGEANGALLAAARDPEPRVREEALGALAAGYIPGAEGVASRALSSDGWTFVREQAVRVLEKAPTSGEVDDALATGLKDKALRVRASALLAIASRRTSGMSSAIRARLDDKRENAEVRAAAARALGALCDRSAKDRLTDLARQLGSPGVPEDDQLVALGALEGLAALQPNDLRTRLAPLLGADAPPEVRQAARKALTARGVCR